MQDFRPVFIELRKIMQPYGRKLVVKTDSDTEYYVNTPHIQKNKSPLFFGAVQTKKGFVSYHLMPIYMKPELLASTSAELKAKMQGKSCFNFKTVEAGLLKELAALTKAGFESYQSDGYV